MCRAEIFFLHYFLGPNSLYQTLPVVVASKHCPVTYIIVGHTVCYIQCDSKEI